MCIGNKNAPERILATMAGIQDRIHNPKSPIPVAIDMKLGLLCRKCHQRKGEPTGEWLKNRYRRDRGYYMMCTEYGAKNADMNGGVARFIPMGHDFHLLPAE